MYIVFSLLNFNSQIRFIIESKFTYIAISVIAHRRINTQNSAIIYMYMHIFKMYQKSI